MSNAVLSIRMHIIYFRKLASHPYDPETLNCLNSLFKRNVLDAPSDKDIEELHDRSIEIIET